MGGIYRLSRGSDQHIANMANRLGRIQSFWTDLNAVHNAMTAEDAKGIIKIGKTVLGTRISCISQESIGLQQT